MKRLLSILLAVLLLLSAMPLGVAANSINDAAMDGGGIPAFVAGSVEAAPGDIVDVPVSIQDNPGIISFCLRIGYDATALELLKVTPLQYTSMVMGPVEKNPVTVNWCEGDRNEDCTDNGEILLLTFVVKEDAAPGDYPITLSYDAEDVFNYELENVYFATTAGGITVRAVCEHEYDYPCANECILCGEWREVEHAYVLISASEPTCSTAGLYRYKCELCGEPYMERIPANGEHVYDDDADPDCNQCGAWREVHQHNYVDNGSKPATCIYDGMRVLYCVDCGEMIYEIIPAFGHQYDNESDPDCNYCGEWREVAECQHEYKTPCDNYCYKCGAWREVEHMYQTTADVAPPCAEHYVKDYVCMNCGHSYSQVMTPWQDHVYDDDFDLECNVCGEWREVHQHNYVDNGSKPATCTYDGMRVLYCLDCGEMIYETIPAFGHQYDNESDPDCNNCGEWREVATPYIYGVVDKTDLKRGDTFTLTVMMENNPGVICWMVDVAFDNTALEAIDIVKGNTFEGGGFSSGATESPLSTLWYNFLSRENYADEGVLFTLTFRVKETAVNGYTALTLYCPDPDNICNLDGDVIAFDFESAAVNVYGCEHAYDNACDAECNLCGEWREVGDHVYAEGVLKDATCGADGVMIYVCISCGESYTENIPATGKHTYDSVYDADCNVCGAVRDVEHVYDNACDPTCNECDYVREVGDHVYKSAVWMDATCGQNGIMRYSCVYCGYSYTVNIPATGAHTYDDKFDPTCNGCGEIREAAIPRIYGVVDKTDLERGDTFTLSVWMENNPGLVAWMVEVGFDESALELIAQSQGDAFAGYGSFSFGKLAEQSPANALWYDFLNPDNTAEGALFTFTFRVKDSAVNGATALTLYCDDPANISNLYGDEVAFQFDSASVTVYGCAHQYDNACDATCNLCGAIREVEGHVYDVMVVAPTCDGDGYTTYICAVCGHKYTTKIPAIGHDYVTTVVEPTCDANGYDLHTCQNCGNSYRDNYTPVRTEHQYYMYETFYSCTQQCYIEYFCLFCSETYREYTEPTGHSPSVYPTIWVCQQYTYCENDWCRAVLTPATGHIYSDLVEQQDPTCVQEGYIRYCCYGCPTYKTETIPATGAHSYDDSHDPACNVCGAVRDLSGHVFVATVTVPATCGTAGVMTYTCSACDQSYTDTIPPTGKHTYDHACDAACNVCGGVRIPADHVYDHACDSDCNVCGATRVPAAHVYDNDCDTACNICGDFRDVEDHPYVGKVTVAATCGADGVKTYTCASCGQRFTEVIPATGKHTYDNACDAACNGCGLTRVPADHVYSGDCDADCNVCGTTRAVTHAYVNAAAPVCGICGAALNIHSYPIVYGTVDNPYVAPGDIFTLTVSMQNNPGLMAWLIEVSYDESVLEMIAQSAGTAFSADKISFSPLRSPGNCLWADFLSGKDYTGNGVLFSFTFRVKEQTAFGMSALHIFCADPDNMTNVMWEQVPFTFVDTAVMVLDHTHVYDNTCDAECNECGFVRPVGDHIYDHACDTACNACGAVRAVEPHVYTAKVTTAATCTANGVKTYTCAICGDSYTESIPALGHTPGAAADCENAQVCTVCGAELAAALGHDYKSVVTAPDCENTGYTTHTCTRCGNSYVDAEVPALGHKYAGKETTAPTCGANGVMTYTCANCGDAYTESIPATGDHTYDYVCDAACNVCGTTRDAEHTYFSDCDSVCEICGQITREAGHTVVHVEAVAATCTANGKREYWYCSVCGMAWLDADGYMNTNLFAVILPMIDHTYDNDFDATCNECGAVREIPVQYGDLNNDGKVNIRDLGVLQQYLNGWDVTIVEAAADLTGDGKVNIRDLGLLQQYLNGWDVTLGG